MCDIPPEITPAKPRREGRRLLEISRIMAGFQLSTRYLICSFSEP
jgi:hypothetical protein